MARVFTNGPGDWGSIQGWNKLIFLEPSFKQNEKFTVKFPDILAKQY